MYSRFFITFCALLSCIITTAQINLTIDFRIPDEENAVGEINGELCVLDSVGVVFLGEVLAGKNNISLVHEGTYNFNLISDKYENWKSNVKITVDTMLTVSLQPLAINLDEVNVTARRAPEVNATGEVYRLTKAAKESGDPYKALSEIPILDVNPFNQTVKLTDGTTPLVLIDGKFVNSGIAPIDPKFIESVEVTEVVSAKYLEMGISKIINLRLKRNVPLYTYIDARTRHDFPILHGFEALNFEVGTRKFAIGGNLSSDYTHHDKVNFASDEQLNDNFKNRSGRNLSNAVDWEANIFLKWVPNQKNYFAGTFLSKGNHTKQWSNAEGNYNAFAYNSEGKDIIHHGGLLGALYYEHSFNDDNKITAYANYNYGYYNEEDLRKDEIGMVEDTSITEYWEYEKSLRHQSKSFVEFEGEHFSAGNKFCYTQDKLTDMTTTPLDHAHIFTHTNYTYLSYNNNWKSLYYMGSLGVQYMRIKTPQAKNHWTRPRISASLTYRLDPRQYIRLSYQLNSDLASTDQLFTFNHSTNPWLRVEGNPYLLPSQINSVAAEYRKNFSPLMLQFYAAVNHQDDIIESVIYSTPDQAISTYRNNGKYTGLTTLGRLNFTNRKVQASFTASYYGEKYHTTGYLPSVGIRAYCKWTIGNWYIFGDIRWTNRTYSAVSQTRYSNPSEAFIQVGWYPIKELRLSVAMPYFWAVRETKTITRSEGYSNVTTMRYKSQSLRPWLLITYTIRRNAKESIIDLMPQM